MDAGVTTGFDIGEAALSWWPALAVVAAAAGAVAVLRMVSARRRLRGRHERVIDGLVVMGVVIAGLIALILAMPLGDGARGQLLSLVGIVVSATIALSSTTFVGNAMAGLMLRVWRNFRPGDFVRVGEAFGRVSEQGLLHTEIQNEDRNLTTLPNLLLVTQPVTVVRSSGVVVSADVSLGYDVARGRVEMALLAAAREAQMTEPFVRVMKLGDFSVSYRVSGFVEDVKMLLTHRSVLNAAVLDALHGAGIEIVSPNFMNQRVLAPAARIIPEGGYRARAASFAHPEARIFDKAEQAEHVEQLAAELAALEEALPVLREAVDKAPDAKARTAAELALAAAEARKLVLTAGPEAHPESPDATQGAADRSV